MKPTLAFDVYGTLIDTQGVVSELKKLIGDAAVDFSRSWREKQLEYAFRRGLMQSYENFGVCTSQALDYTCDLYSAELSKEQKRVLLDFYRTLPAFNDVKEGLASLKAEGCRLYAFSNGTAEAVEALLVASGIREYFLDVVSVDDLKTFKPDPAVYRHFLSVSGASVTDAWLISSNPFDVTGAISSGMRAAWVKRSTDALFDPWDIQPTATIESLCQLKDVLKEHQGKRLVRRLPSD